MKIKVLVADDEKDICKAIRFLLEQEDYSVTCVYSGEEALDAIHKDHFDAILTDLKMRGIDGMALLQKARELSPTTPVIIMTAFVSHESALEATRCGAADYIVKPFLNEDIKLTLRKIIDRNRMRLDMMKNDIGVG